MIEIIEETFDHDDNVIAVRTLADNDADHPMVLRELAALDAKRSELQQAKPMESTATPKPDLPSLKGPSSASTPKPKATATKKRKPKGKERAPVEPGPLSVTPKGRKGNTKQRQKKKTPPSPPKDGSGGPPSPPDSGSPPSSKSGGGSNRTPNKVPAASGQGSKPSSTPSENLSKWEAFIGSSSAKERQTDRKSVV